MCNVNVLVGPAALLHRKINFDVKQKLDAKIKNSEEKMFPHLQAQFDFTPGTESEILTLLMAHAQI